MNFVRQEKIFDPNEFNATVTIIGVGGIGSFAAAALTKLGVKKLVIYDGDSIEVHNQPNQLFRMEAISHPKVAEVKGLCQSLSDDIEIQDNFEMFEDQTVEPGVVISGVDSAEARQKIWSKMKFNPLVRLYIDARIGGQIIRVFAVHTMDSESIKKYEATLYTGKEKLPELGCTERNIIDVGFTAAALVTNLTRKHLKGEKIPSQVLVSMESLDVMKFE